MSSDTIFAGMQPLKKHTVWMALLAALVGVSGCATGPTIESQIDPEADLSQYQTFTILPIPDHVPGADPGALLPFKRPIEESIRSALLAKGLSETSAEDADLAFNVMGEVVAKTKITDWGYDYPPAWSYRYPYYAAPSRSNVSVKNYKEVTLAIEAYDQATKRLVWVGWAVDRTTDSKAPEMETVRGVVAEILQQLELNLTDPV